MCQFCLICPLIFPSSKLFLKITNDFSCFTFKLLIHLEIIWTQEVKYLSNFSPTGFCHNNVSELFIFSH